MARKWWTLIAVCTGVFMLLLDITIVNVALPDIQRAFSGSLSDLQWVIDAYALTLAAFLLTAGSTADRLGRRRMFAIGIVVFTLGSGPVRWRNRQSCSSRLRARCRASAVRSCSRSPWRCSPGVQAVRAGGRIWRVRCIDRRGGRDRSGARRRVITSGLSWRWIFFVNIPIGLSLSS